jgi:hypothetical protein
MIIPIDQGQSELKVALTRPGTGDQLVSKELIRLVIKPPPKERFAQLSPIVRKGDWGYPLPLEDYPPNRDAWPLLIYPAFDIDDDGAIIFRLDRRFWQRPCGRYIGDVMVGDYKAVSFELDLNPHRYLITSVELNDKKECP